MTAQGGFGAHGRWWVIAGCFIGLAISANNVVMTSYGVHMKAITEEFGWSRGQYSAAISIAAFTAAVLAPIIGWCLDRFGSRRVVLAGSVILPLVMALFSLLNGSYALYVGMAVLIGAGLAATSPLVYLSLPPQWFDRNLGVSLALAGAGLGVGQIIFPPLIQVCVAASGWRMTWVFIAGLILVIGLLNALTLIRDNPAYQNARTAARRDRSTQDDLLDGDTFAVAIRRPVFWLIAAPYMLIALVYSGAVVQMAPLLGDRGFSPGEIAGAMIALGVAALGARIVAGVLLDRLSFVLVGGGFFLAQALGFVVLASGAGGAAPYVAAALIGAGMGAESDLLPFALRRAFGMRAFGRLFGVAAGVFQLGPICGPLLLGLTFDVVGAYEPMLFVFAALSTLAAGLLALAGAVRARDLSANAKTAMAH